MLNLTHLPVALQTLLAAHAGVSCQELAASAVDAISQLRSPEEQSAAGLATLRTLKAKGDSGTQDFVERALEVMQKFPNFARPRAAVALRALSALAKS